MAANRVKLTICGANYVIVSEDEESYVQELGTRLDEEMNELMTKNQAISVTGAAVLKALDYLDELRKATMSADNMRGDCGQDRNHGCEGLGLRRAGGHPGGCGENH